MYLLSKKMTGLEHLVNKIKQKNARYLKRVFQPNNIASEFDVIHCQPLNVTKQKIRYFTLLEVTHELDTNINQKKAPGFHEISLRILEELSKKAIILLAFNAIL